MAVSLHMGQEAAVKEVPSVPHDRSKGCDGRRAERWPWGVTWACVPSQVEPYLGGSGEPFKDFKRETDMILFAFWGGFGYIVESRLECRLEAGITSRGSNLGWKRQYS